MTMKETKAEDKALKQKATEVELEGGGVGAHAATEPSAALASSSGSGSGGAGGGGGAPSSRMGDAKLKRVARAGPSQVGAHAVSASATSDSGTVASRLGESKMKRDVRASNADSPSTPGAHASNKPRLGENKAKRDIRGSSTTESTPAPATASATRSSATTGTGKLVPAGSSAKMVPVGSSANLTAPGSVKTIASASSSKGAAYVNQSAKNNLKSSTVTRIVDGQNRSNFMGYIDGGEEPDSSGPVSGALSIPGMASSVRGEMPRLSDDKLAVARPVPDDEFSPVDLPQADGYDPEATKKRVQETKKKNIVYLIGAIVIIAIVAVVVALTVNRDEKVVVKVQSSAPSQSPSMAPTSIQDSILDLLPDYTVDAVLQSPDSPQGKAMDWLLGDPKLMDYPDWRLLQRFVMATLYYSTNGDEWFNDFNWTQYDVHECNWLNHNDTAGLVPIVDDHTHEIVGYQFEIPGNPCTVMGNQATTGTTGTGVEEQESDEIVRHIWFHNNNLDGPMPRELFLLTNLQSIAFEDETVLGIFPTEIGLLPDLQGIGFNLLDMRASSIPTEIGLCTNLKYFTAILSNFGGSIPSEIGLLTDLKLFWMSETHNMYGSIPTEIGNLRELSFVYIQEIGLTGPLPTEIGLLTKMTDLDISGNRFSGSLPTELGMLNHSESLNLHTNIWTGVIPSEIGQLPYLHWFNVINNRMTGTPTSQLSFCIACTYQRTHLIFKNLTSLAIFRDTSNRVGSTGSHVSLWTCQESIYRYDCVVLCLSFFCSALKHRTLLLASALLILILAQGPCLRSMEILALTVCIPSRFKTTYCPGLFPPSLPEFPM